MAKLGFSLLLGIISIGQDFDIDDIIGEGNPHLHRAALIVSFR